jgi:hypothetical protein
MTLGVHMTNKLSKDVEKSPSKLRRYFIATATVAIVLAKYNGVRFFR